MMRLICSPMFLWTSIMTSILEAVELTGVSPGRGPAAGGAVFPFDRVPAVGPDLAHVFQTRPSNNRYISVMLWLSVAATYRCLCGLQCRSCLVVAVYPSCQGYITKPRVVHSFRFANMHGGPVASCLA
ncbi:hypothetical protein C7974DRAFT_212192 [Boeremia exigua]|uniref:uncharacterized protein n=1 Tax=Boeremia exigua TaxID=749465 RepID=UPI001E8E797A|nr:uncharacterized protein C7974DRAFT_212192 [Boeremia exigua]KAH6621860.1 hypothetical protein C7974DRAFT_212192 [Boeremia exigua]